MTQSQGQAGYGTLIDALEGARADEEDDELSHRFTIVRDALGLTQPEMARVYRVGFSTYCGYEQCRSMPRGVSGREIKRVLRRLEKRHNLTQ